MSNRFLEKETIISRPLEEVFNFFSNAENLNLITPSQLEFKVISPLPIVMRKGEIIDYKIRLFGIPLKWRTEITEWEPPYKFVDMQRKGPYLVWIHEHTFVERGNSTYMYDKVEYQAPGWVLEPIIHTLFVKKNLEEIFDYREKSLKEIFV